jgi:DNA-binding LacI/PurR family transcriptional regulator
VKWVKGVQEAIQPTYHLPIIIDAQNEPEQFERHLEMMLERELEALIIIVQ